MRLSELQESQNIIDRRHQNNILGDSNHDGTPDIHDGKDEVTQGPDGEYYWRPDGIPDGQQGFQRPENLDEADLPYRNIPNDQNKNNIPDHLESARDKFKASQRKSSPIILDLDGDGVETTKVNQGAWFDHDGNGYAESTGWVGKNDGLLVRDVDGSGYIDAGSELFGNNTKLSNGKFAANGFEALRDLDAIANGGNADGKIDSNDAAWASIKVWKDANGDGYHSDGEVISLEQAGVQSIYVAYSNSAQVDANGNAHKQLGSFTKTDGSTAKATDVWFAVDKMNTIAEEWEDVSSEVAALPELRGYGNVANLRQAMMKDTTGGLKALVEKFSVATSRQERLALMDSIIYKWTGAENARYRSRGNYIDARMLTALETLFGESLGKNPGGKATRLAVESYQMVKTYFYNLLTAQTALAPLFQGMEYVWDTQTESFKIDLTGTAQAIGDQFTQSPALAKAQLAEFILVLKGLGFATNIKEIAFYEALVPISTELANMARAGFDIAVADDGNNTLNGDSANDYIDGQGGNDTINSGAGDDLVFGGAGNDVIYDIAGDDDLDGGDGNDTITDLAGDDVIDGGNGNDRIIDHTGNDVILGGAGNDYILDMAGNDDIDGGDGDDTIIDQNGSDTIDGGAGNDNIQDYGTGTNSIFGGAGNDSIIFSHLANNTVDGGEGDDTLKVDAYSADGNASTNTLSGGTGNDSLSSGVSTDTYLFNLGDGQDVISDIDSGSYRSRGKTRYTSYGRLDTLQFGEGISKQDIQVSRSGNNLVLTIVTATSENVDQVTIAGWFSSSIYQIEKIAFADQSSWSVGDFQKMVMLQLGTANNDTLYGWLGHDAITGDAGDDFIADSSGGNDVLDGGDGDDEIVDNLGNDQLLGGAGNDVITDLTGSDSIDGGEGDDIITDAGYGVNQISAGAGNDKVTFSQLAHNTIDAGAGNDTVSIATNTLDAASYSNQIRLGLGNDKVVSGVGSDTYHYQRGDGHDEITDVDASSYTKKRNTYFASYGKTDRLAFGQGIATENLSFSKVGHDLVIHLDTTGNTDSITIKNWTDVRYRIEEIQFANGQKLNQTQINDLIEYYAGTSSADSFTLIKGNKVIQSLAGNDVLNVSTGNNLLDAGSGIDTLTAGNGNDMFIGGTGNDTITTGTGFDVMSFNKGDGQDLINASTGADNTISLGGAFAYDELSLSKSANNLILKVGAADQITLKDWYLGTTNKSVANLQVIAEAVANFELGGADALRNNKVESFNFASLVAQFDADVAANATNASNWQLTDARLTAHLQSGSDTEAIGGDLAYQYGRNNSLTGMGLNHAQGMMGNANFGQTAQAINDPNVWQSEAVKLA